MNDALFLLSIEEYEKYEDKIPFLSSWWYLRSPGCCYNDTVAGVGKMGSVDKLGCYADMSYDCVRPALNLSNLKSEKDIEYLNEDYLLFKGHVFKKIDQWLYISVNGICLRRFDAYSNDYETSEIRKFLLEFAE